MGGVGVSKLDEMADDYKSVTDVRALIELVRLADRLEQAVYHAKLEKSERTCRGIDAIQNAYIEAREALEKL